VQQRPTAPGGAASVGNCPQCGYQAAGVPGKRYCVVCAENF
jgi:hypothetical protein